MLVCDCCDCCGCAGGFSDPRLPLAPPLPGALGAAPWRPGGVYVSAFGSLGTRFALSEVPCARGTGCAWPCAGPCAGLFCHAAGCCCAPPPPPPCDPPWWPPFPPGRAGLPDSFSASWCIRLATPVGGGDGTIPAALLFPFGVPGPGLVRPIWPEPLRAGLPGLVLPPPFVAPPAAAPEGPPPPPPLAPPELFFFFAEPGGLPPGPPALEEAGPALFPAFTAPWLPAPLPPFFFPFFPIARHHSKTPFKAPSQVSEFQFPSKPITLRARL